MLDGVVDCLCADHTETAHPSQILAAEGVYGGSLETSDKVRSKSAGHGSLHRT